MLARQNSQTNMTNFLPDTHQRLNEQLHEHPHVANAGGKGDKFQVPDFVWQTSQRVGARFARGRLGRVVMRIGMWAVRFVKKDANAVMLKNCLVLAPKGLVVAQYNLGIMHAHAQGVQQDYEKALEYFTMAAHQGYASAQYNVGVMYAHGMGVPRNDEKALKYYLLAARQGDASAQHNLGVMFAHGLGVPLDYDQSLKYYRLAAQQDYPASQHNLGVMYGSGMGVRRNYVHAYLWFNIASAFGHEKSEEGKRIMASEMTPDDIYRARMLTRQYFARSQGNG